MADLPKLPPGVSVAFLELMEQPVSFLPAIARLCGSATAGLMLSQAIYWSRTKVVSQRGGWFWKTAQEWQEETCLTVREQITAREVIRDRGFWNEEKKKVNGAPTIHFKVDFAALLTAFLQNGNCENAKSEIAKTQNQKPEIAKKENHETQFPIKEAETTSETTRDYTERVRPDRPLLDLLYEFSLIGPSPDLPQEEDKMRRMRAACKKLGYSLDCGKEMLQRHPEWAVWQWLPYFDSPGEIPFPLDESFPTLTFAQKVIDELCLRQPGMKEIVADAIEFCVKFESKSKNSAVEFLIAKARDELQHGGTPNRFWFSDRKWRVNDNGYTSKADRQAANISAKARRVYLKTLGIPEDGAGSLPRRSSGE